MRSLPDILLIDDDEDDYILVRDLLSEIFAQELKLSWVSDGKDGLAALLEGGFDICLVDLRLGEQDGIELVRRGVAEGCKAPIILLTGLGSRDIDLEAMSAGAVDYLVKGELTAPLLDKAIRYAITRQQLLRTKVEANNLLRRKNQKLSELYQTAHRFVENVSHEFRTPLTVIKEYASIIQDGLAGEVSEEQHRYLGIITDRVEDLSIMVSDMLDISRLEAGLLGVSRAPQDVEAIIERFRPALERRALASGSALEIALDGDLPQVYCDANQIGRVLINLVVNALKFTPDGGKVRVWARFDSAEAEVTVGVTDSGPGISPPQIEAIFERFKQLDGDVRASTKGFGLGLSIVKELVQLNFGEISVESQVGEGSTFSFTLPMFEASSVMARYLAVVEQFRNGSSWVSLIALSVEAGLDASQNADIEELLQRNLRGSDLLFRKAPNVWLLVAASNQLELECLLERLNEVWNAENRNRLDAALPSLNMEVMGGWQVSEKREELMARFDEEFSNSGQSALGQASHSPCRPLPMTTITGDLPVVTD